jgi:hypothetical protein
MFFLSLSLLPPFFSIAFPFPPLNLWLNHVHCYVTTSEEKKSSFLAANGFKINKFKALVSFSCYMNLLAAVLLFFVVVFFHHDN